MAATTVKPSQRQLLCCREKAALRITSSASVWAGNKSSVTFPLGYVAGNSIVTSVLAEEAVKSSKFTTLSNIRDVHAGRERSLGKQTAELGRGVSKHLWCRKTMFISAHKLTQTLASWRCEPEQSRTTSKRDVAVHNSRGCKVIARSCVRAVVNISLLLDFFQHQHVEHVHGTQNERWQDESTQRPVCADRTLDDLLFIQIKIFPSIKLLQRNLSDVSLSGVRCASFMRRYPFFLFDWHIFYSCDLFLSKPHLYRTLRQTDASVATVWCQRAFLRQPDWHDFESKRSLLPALWFPVQHGNQKGETMTVIMSPGWKQHSTAVPKLLVLSLFLNHGGFASVKCAS